MKRTIAAVLAAAMAFTVAAPLVPTDGFAAGKSAKSAKSAKAGKKGKSGKGAKAAGKSCGTFMYWDKKSGKCADARNKKA